MYPSIFILKATVCHACITLPQPTHNHLLQARLGSLATETAALREDNEVLTHLLVETKVLYAEQLSKAFTYPYHQLVKSKRVSVCVQYRTMQIISFHASS